MLKSFIVIFLFCLLTQHKIRSFKSRPRNYTRKSYVLQWVLGNNPCQQDSQSNQCWNSKKMIAIQIIGFVACVMIYLIGNNIWKKKKQQKDLKQIQQVMNQYKIQSEAHPSNLDVINRQKLIDDFMKNQKTMVCYDKSKTSFCKLKVTDLKKQNNDIFRIKMIGTDQIGKSKIQGLIIFRTNGIGIKLAKIYDDIKQAQNSGILSTLFFQGFGSDKMQGTWGRKGQQKFIQQNFKWKIM